VLEAAAGIPPVAYLVERIGGERVHVTTLIQPGQDPHTYELTPKQVQTLGRAAMFFKVGLPFENRVIEKLQAIRPGFQAIDTVRGIRKIPLIQSCGDDQSQEEEGDLQHAHASVGMAPGDHAEREEHLHGTEDLHVWLSPLNVKIQAAEIAAALEKADPDHADLYRANLSKLQTEIDAVHAKNLKRFKPLAGRTFYVFHPAFGYFADCYGLKQASIEAGERPPSAKELQMFVRRAKDDGAIVIFLQPQFNPRGSQNVAEVLGAEVVPLNDLGKDVIANLDDMGEKIEKALKSKTIE
jgi:zinc transport system substrate-binding protein